MKTSLAHLVREAIYPNSPVLTDQVKTVLQRSPLDIVDAGASFGPDVRWRGLTPFIRFITFEPDERTFETTLRVVDGNFSFSCGLGSESAQKPFYLTRSPQSSSTYKPKFGFLDSFPVSALHEVLENSVIQVRALDQVLEQLPQVHAAFLKIDVEGSELDVLKGSEKTLGKDVLGVQVESSFSERLEGAPYFADLDQYVRDKGFVLFDLLREYWVRKNAIYGVNSKPQVIWADAVYFLSPERFFGGLKDCDALEKENRLCHFVVILLAYAAHDFAWELVRLAEGSGQFGADLIASLRSAIKSSITNPYLYLGKAIPFIIGLLIVYVLSIPIRPFHASSERYLREISTRFLTILSRLIATRGIIYDFRY